MRYGVSTTSIPHAYAASDYETAQKRLMKQFLPQAGTINATRWGNRRIVKR